MRECKFEKLLLNLRAPKLVNTLPERCFKCVKIADIYCGAFGCIRKWNLQVFSIKKKKKEIDRSYVDFSSVDGEPSEAWVTSWWVRSSARIPRPWRPSARPVTVPRDDEEEFARRRRQTLSKTYTNVCPDNNPTTCQTLARLQSIELMDNKRWQPLLLCLREQTCDVALLLLSQQTHTQTQANLIFAAQGRIQIILKRSVITLGSVLNCLSFETNRRNPLHNIYARVNPIKINPILKTRSLPCRVVYIVCNINTYGPDLNANV